MATEPSGDYQSDLPVPPGELLAEEIDARGMTRRQFAAALGLSPQSVGELLRGRRGVTAETALELERVLGVSAVFWLRLEASYRLALARQRRQARSA